MKQSFFQIKIVSILGILLSILTFMATAQERQSMTMPFKGGTLTFQYYEKDGVKVPDEAMEFEKGIYTEKGENKDGYREGRWIATTGNKARSVTAHYFYRNGLLDGITIFKNSCTDKYSKQLYPEATYNFSNGRLYGENKIIHNSDTIYCNFGENGKWIGVWKIVSPDKTVVVEYDDKTNIKDSYEVDVLGQKKQTNIIPTSLTMALLCMDNYFKEIPFTLRDKKNLITHSK